MNTIYSIMKENIQKFGDRRLVTYISSDKKNIQKKYIDFYYDVMKTANYFLAKI